ncbi:putative ATP/GTP-binding protein [Candidatus Rhodobacter oscarellae]|uniref:Putative ATP/GTP-binding protein n=1 Tax=Candidatus Rhodobacter oscarellae TaxID=1675527 RepID=A0A0J9EAN6_9RHOB|nr:AAA family ATPase [Candidatus Rhodobacter lobularis]KMW59676.1 putative ATP/GTP-binding protein [Candidatus Rhodobacter lobularis]
MSLAERPFGEFPMSKRPTKKTHLLGGIYTFYSYKGGVGRSMALANVGALLALEGFKVLLLDWDLEAPGLEAFFQGKKQCQLEGSVEVTPGIIDLLTARSEARTLDWRSCRLSVKFRGSELDFISAGQRSREYSTRVQNVDWTAMFEEHDIGNYLENLREEMKLEYDFILIDSRTGITDIGDICTVLMPDYLITLFVSNQQNINGCKEIIRRAREARQNLPVNRSRLMVVPMPCRDESDSEYEEASRWRSVFESNFSEELFEWLPAEFNATDYFSRMYIPYIPIWSFGERLPILESRRELRDPKTIGASYLAIAGLLRDRLNWYSAVGVEERSSIQAAAIELQMRGEETRELQVANERLQLGLSAVMFVTAVALSLASGIGTFDGMRAYSSNPLVAGGVTFGIQAQLLATSWWLASNWRRGLSGIITGGFVFLICAFVSIFFSTASLYRVIDNGPGDGIALRSVESAVVTIIQDLSKGLNEQIAASASGIVSGNSVANWITSVDAIVNQSEAAIAEISETSRRRQDRLAAEIAGNRDELDQARGQLFDLETAQAKKQNELDAIIEKRDLELAKISESRAKISTVQDLIAADTVRRDTEAAAGGCGRTCSEIELSIARNERSVQAANEELRRSLLLEKELSDQVQVLSRTLSSFVDDIDLLNLRVVSLEARINDLRAAFASEPLAIVAPSELRSLVTEFEAQNFSAYEIAVVRCESLRGLLIESNSISQDAAPQCSAPGISVEILQYREIQERFEIFEANCSVADIPSQSLDVQKVVNFGRICLDRAGLGGAENTALRATLDDFSRVAAADAHDFAVLQLALFVVKDPLAYFALALAIAIDCLIFIVAFVGANVPRQRSSLKSIS